VIDIDDPFFWWPALAGGRGGIQMVAAVLDAPGRKVTIHYLRRDLKYEVNGSHRLCATPVKAAPSRALHITLQQRQIVEEREVCVREGGVRLF
jgi:hypothetical protein